jgi:hypothetical protein
MDKIGNKKSIDIVTDVTITNALAIAICSAPTGVK